MPLSKVIHYPDTNSVEATWVDAEGVQIRCHSYADVQMDMLIADLGEDAPAYADLIALVEASIQPLAPIPPIPALQQIAVLESATLLPRVTREFMLISFAAQAAAAGIDPMTSPAYAKLKALDDQIAVLRKSI